MMHPPHFFPRNIYKEPFVTGQYLKFHDPEASQNQSTSHFVGDHPVNDQLSWESKGPTSPHDQPLKKALFLEGLHGGVLNLDFHETNSSSLINLNQQTNKLYSVTVDPNPVSQKTSKKLVHWNC